MYKNVYLDSLLVRQLNYRDFICNALNCLNEENKRFTNYLSLFFFFILIIIVVAYYYLIIYHIYI
jgi:hypothetical protein